MTKLFPLADITNQLFPSFLREPNFTLSASSSRHYQLI